MEKKDRHRGFHLSVWLNDDVAKKLEDLCSISGQTKTKIITNLISGQRIQDKSFTRTVSYLAKLGGLLKHSIEHGQSIKVYKLGEQLVKIARTIHANNNRQEN